MKPHLKREANSVQNSIQKQKQNPKHKQNHQAQTQKIFSALILTLFCSLVIADSNTEYDTLHYLDFKGLPQW
jgi:FtsH-binding integral membrane protein